MTVTRQDRWTVRHRVNLNCCDGGLFTGRPHPARKSWGAARHREADVGLRLAGGAEVRLVSGVREDPQTLNS
jgi:hypothetical protein